MTLQVERRGSVLALTGRLDAPGAAELERAGAGLGDVPAVWDLGGLVFLSSAGLRSLMVMDRRVRASGARTRLAAIPPAIMDVLVIAGLDRHWAVHASVDEALAAVDAGAGAAVPDLSRGPSGIRYQVTPGPARGRMTLFDAAGGPPLALRLDELGVALGDGGFGADAARARSGGGTLLATGNSVFVQLDGDAVTDWLDSVVPARTFAWVSYAIRLDMEGTTRYRPNDTLAWAALRADMAGAARGSPWAAVVSCRLDGRPAVVLCAASGDRPVRCAALMADPADLAPAGASPADCLGTLTGLSPLHLASPRDESRLDEASVWYAVSPEHIDGNTTRLAIEAADPLPEAWEPIVRSLFADASRVRLRRLTGGYMASTFAAESVDHAGRRTLPTVLKISQRTLVEREEAAYREHVRPFILNNSTVLFGQCAFGESAGLRYNFVGITGAESRLRPLESLYADDDFETALALVRQLLGNVLDPWYGQATPTAMHPFADHDPRRLWPSLPAIARRVLGIDADATRIDCPPLGRSLPNPYHFLAHRWDAMLGRQARWARCVTHGDLNLNNVLVDERHNLYVIDFAEARVRNVAADFARLELIALLHTTRLRDREDLHALLHTLAAGLEGSPWEPHPGNGGDDPMRARAVRLATEVRALAARRVADRGHEAAWFLPLLEWSLPVVAFRDIEPERQQLAAWTAGLLLERMGSWLDGSGA